MLIESRGMHANAAINRTHRASTGTTGDADIRGAAPDQEAAFLPPPLPPSPQPPQPPSRLFSFGLSRCRDALPILAARNGSHVVTRLAGGRWIGVFIYVRCSGEDKAEAGRCGVTTTRGGPMGAALTQTFFRVRLKPAAKLHYVEVKDVNGMSK